MSNFASKESNEHLAALEQEKARLSNAVAHLERSNADLVAALSADGEDKEYEDAVKENKRTVADFQEKIYKLSVEIAGITGQVESVTPKRKQEEAGTWL
mmetsp:Transcript_35564/g.87458  ORF Transcript_35564/g.87458 Transcript_35564/m.87458 type:complete len:99 (+) Transcript_35564:385-681(+)